MDFWIGTVIEIVSVHTDVKHSYWHRLIPQSLQQTSQPLCKPHPPSLDTNDAQPRGIDIPFDDFMSDTSNRSPDHLRVQNDRVVTHKKTDTRLCRRKAGYLMS